eukprot:118341-Pyramimonas_sp.AAC.1
MGQNHTHIAIRKRVSIIPGGRVYSLSKTESLCCERCKSARCNRRGASYMAHPMLRNARGTIYAVQLCNSHVEP